MGFGFRLALIRRLQRIDPDVGNLKVVQVYKNRRFSYKMSPWNNVWVDCVGESSIRQSVLIVPDPWDIVKRYGVSKRLNNIPDDIEGSRAARFFEVAMSEQTY